MLATAFIFAFACIVFELYLVTQVKFFRNTVGPLLHKYPFAALCFSTGLSFLVGELFGAAGVMVLMSAMFSTVVTIVLYGSGAVDWYIHGHHKVYIAKAKQSALITIKMFVLLWKIFTAPIRFIMWCKIQWMRITAFCRIQHKRFAHK